MTTEKQKNPEQQSKNPVESALRKLSEADIKTTNQEIEKQVEIVVKAKKVFHTEFDKLKDLVTESQAKKGEFDELVEDIKKF